MNISLVGFIIIAIVTIYIVHKLFNKHRNRKRIPVNKYRLNATNKTKKKNNNKIGTEVTNNLCIDGDCMYSPEPETRIRKAYPIGQNQFKFSIKDNHFYLPPNYCKERPVESIDEFHNKFFKFRDHTERDSSIRFDPVDKMAIAKLDGELANTYNKKKIKDIYNYMVHGPVEYDKKYDEDPTDAFN